MSEFEVTLAVPTYNARARIARCLRSLVAQGEPKVEILVVDNHSTDATADVAQQTLAAAPNARVIVNETNIGRVQNWNRCIDLARGKFIRFLMVNDVQLVRSTRIMLDQANLHPDCVQVFTKELLGRTPADEVPAMREPSDPQWRSSDDSLAQFSREGYAVGGSLNGILLNAQVLQQQSIRFDPSLPFFADCKLNMELAAHGSSVSLQEESFIFDYSAAGRHFHVGGNGGALLREYRGVCDQLARILRRHPVPSAANPYASQLRLFKQFCAPRGGVSIRDCFAAFSAAPMLGVQAAAYLAFIQAKKLRRTMMSELRAPVSAVKPKTAS